MILWHSGDPQPRSRVGALVGLLALVVAAAGVATVCAQALAVVLVALSGRLP